MEDLKFTRSHEREYCLEVAGSESNHAATKSAFTHGWNSRLIGHERDSMWGAALDEG
jgi:hypothetical protein